jgi:hypothetical protein
MAEPRRLRYFPQTIAARHSRGYFAFSIGSAGKAANTRSASMM